MYDSKYLESIAYVIDLKTQFFSLSSDLKATLLTCYITLNSK